MKNYRVRINGKTFNVQLEAVEEVKKPLEKEENIKVEENFDKAKGLKDVVSPIQGNIINVLVKKGQKVKTGDVLLLIEAMKLENEVNAYCDGEVEEILVKNGDSVTIEQVLVRIK